MSGRHLHHPRRRRGDQARSARLLLSTMIATAGVYAAVAAHFLHHPTVFGASVAITILAALNGLAAL